jgi:hypothetical protein
LVDLPIDVSWPPGHPTALETTARVRIDETASSLAELREGFEVVSDKTFS